MESRLTLHSVISPNPQARTEKTRADEAKDPAKRGLHGFFLSAPGRASKVGASREARSAPFSNPPPFYMTGALPGFPPTRFLRRCLSPVDVLSDALDGLL